MARLASHHNNAIFSLLISVHIVSAFLAGGVESAAAISSVSPNGMLEKDVDVTNALSSSDKLASAIISSPAPAIGNQITIDAFKSGPSQQQVMPVPAEKTGLSHPLQLSAFEAGQQASKQAFNSKLVKSTEKLKRGLAKFMNHQMNPAPFFVPPAPANAPSANAMTQTGSAQQQSSEPVAIVGSEGTWPGEVLIAKPNRVAQTRHFGGPLRWGR